MMIYEGRSDFVLACQRDPAAPAFPWTLYLAFLFLALVRLGGGCCWSSPALAGQGIFAAADLLVAGLLWAGPGSPFPPSKKLLPLPPRSWLPLAGASALLLFGTGFLLLGKGILYLGAGGSREVHPFAAVLPLFIAPAIFFLGRRASRGGPRGRSLFLELLAAGSGREILALAAVSAAVTASRLGYRAGELLLLLAAGAAVLQLSLELAREWLQCLVRPLPAERVLAALGRRWRKEVPGVIPGRLEAFPREGFLQINVHILGDSGKEQEGGREEELAIILKRSLGELDRPGIRLVPVKEAGEGKPYIYRLFHS